MLYKTIDLCAGIGGLRKGFELTGSFQNVLSAEIDPFACMTYNYLYGENAHNDLTSEEFKTKLEKTSYDILLAGFPCQTFSKAGLEEGFNNAEKGIIFSHLADIIKRTRPRAIFLENVDNLVRHDKGNTFRVIMESLDKKYGTEALQGIDNLLPEKNDKNIYEDLNELLEFNAEPKYYMASGYLNTLIRHKERERKKGNGFGYRVVNAPKIEHPVANTIMATGGSGKERNLVYDPQEGIAGMVIRGKKSPLNDKGIRVMTPREWGKLQGFINYAFLDENGVDHFSFPNKVSMVQQYKQFGNSVTIPVIETMADFMLDCFKALGEIPGV